MKTLMSCITMIILSTNVFAQRADSTLGFYYYYETNATNYFEEKTVQDIPQLEQNIWKEHNFWRQTRFLHTLWKLNAPSTYQLTLAFLDTIQMYPRHLYPKRYEGLFDISEDSITLTAKVTDILIGHGNYSTVPFIFTMIEERNGLAEMYDMLPVIIQKVPQFETQAKNLLINFARTGGDIIDRADALSCLIKLYGINAMESLLLERATQGGENERMFTLRMMVEYKYPNLRNFAMNRLYADTSAKIQWQIACVLSGSLLDTLHDRRLIELWFGNPKDCKFLKDFLQNNPNNSSYSSIESALWRASKYRYHPAVVKRMDAFSVTAHLDTLASYTQQLYEIGWLGPQTFRDEITQYITNAKTKYQQGDTLNAAYYLLLLRTRAIQEYKDSTTATAEFITQDIATAHLAFPTEYLIKRICTIDNLTKLTPTLTTLSTETTSVGVPTFTLTLTGEKFTVGTIVQWNGQPLPTTYISSTQLECTIDANLVQTPSVNSISVKTVSYSSNTKQFSVTQ